MKKISLLLLLNIITSIYTTMYSHPLNDDNEEDDMDIKKVVDSLSINKSNTTLNINYNNGTIKISSEEYKSNLYLLITKEVDGQQYILDTNLSTGEKTASIVLPDGSYTVNATMGKCSQLLFLTIERGIGQSSNQ